MFPKCKGSQLERKKKKTRNAKAENVIRKNVAVLNELNKWKAAVLKPLPCRKRLLDTAKVTPTAAGHFAGDHGPSNGEFNVLTLVSFGIQNLIYRLGKQSTPGSQAVRQATTIMLRHDGQRQRTPELTSVLRAEVSSISYELAPLRGSRHNA